MRVTSSLQPIVRIVFEETGILQPPAFPKVEPGRATDAVVLSGPRDIRKEFGYDEPVRCLFQMFPESPPAEIIDFLYVLSGHSNSGILPDKNSFACPFEICCTYNSLSCMLNRSIYEPIMAGSRTCPVVVYGKAVTVRRKYRRRITSLFIRTFFICREACFPARFVS